MNRQRAFLLIGSLMAALVLGRPAPSAAQGPPPDPRFGIVETYVNPAEATAAGAGYTRVTLRWDVIQPAGRDDWKPANVPDPFIEAELAAGREVAAVLIGTPTWAGNGVNDSRAVPDMEAWGNFTKRVAQQYRGRINTWIIWNEVDVWDPANPGSTWLGTEADYLQLLKSAYSNIKLVDPAMQVFVGGLTYHWDAQAGREQYLTRLLRLIAADPAAPDHNYYFDGVTYHLYYNPREMFDIVTGVRAGLDSFGLEDKQVWVNETNAPPTDDPLEPPPDEPQFAVSSAEQAAFVIQAFALLVAGGADRIALYKFRNDPDAAGVIEPFGLLRADNSRRPAFDAFKVVTTYFSGYTNYSWVHQGNFYIVTLDRGEQTTTVLWNTSSEDRPFTINAIAPQAMLVDPTGAVRPITAAGGVYTIVLPGATCPGEACVIGGAPRLLVEEGSSNRRASLVPLATETPTPTPPPTAPPPPPPPPPPTVTGTPPTTPQPEPGSTAIPVAAANSATATPPPAGPAPLPQKETAPPPKPVTFILGSIFTPNRLVLLVVLGAVLFTLIYFIQFRLWTRRRH